MDDPITHTPATKVGAVTGAFSTTTRRKEPAMHTNRPPNRWTLTDDEFDCVRQLVADDFEARLDEGLVEVFPGVENFELDDLSEAYISLLHLTGVVES